MSFFDILGDSAFTVAHLKSSDGTKQTIELGNLDFSFSLTAQETNFDGLFALKAGDAPAVDYDPYFSLSARPETTASGETLLAAVASNTVFEEIEIVTSSENFDGKLVERFTHTLEDARIYGYGSVNGGVPTFGIAFDDITFASTLYDDSGDTGKSTVKSFDASFDADELAKANPETGNTQVEQGGFVTGESPEDIGHMVIGLYDSADPVGKDENPFTIAPTEFLFAVTEFELGVTRAFDHGTGKDGPIANIQPISLEIDVANRAETAQLASNIANFAPGDESRFWAFDNFAVDGDVPALDLKAEQGFRIGGMSFGGDDRVSIEAAYLDKMGSVVTAVEDFGKAVEIDKTTYDQADIFGVPGGAATREGIADGKDAFLSFSGITGDSAFEKGTAFDLIDYDVSFDMEYLFHSSNAVQGARVDFKPLVIEINPYTRGGSELLQRFLSGDAIPDAKLSLVSEDDQSRVFEEMNFSGLSVLSYGMGMKNNTRIELGYDDWDLKTRNYNSDGKASESEADFGYLIAQNRLGADGKLLASTQMDSVYTVGAGAFSERAANLQGFMKIDDKVSGDAQFDAFKGQVEIEDFAWSGARVGGRVEISDLGLTMGHQPVAHAYFANELLEGAPNFGMEINVVSSGEEAGKGFSNLLTMTASTVYFSDLQDHGGTGLGLGVVWGPRPDSASENTIKFYESDAKTGATDTSPDLTATMVGGQIKRAAFADIGELPQIEDARLFLHIAGIEGNADESVAEGDFGGWIEIEDYGLNLATNYAAWGNHFRSGQASASTLDVHARPGDPALAELLRGLVDETDISDVKIARVLLDSDGYVADQLEYSFKDVSLSRMLEESDTETALSFNFDSFQFQSDRRDLSALPGTGNTLVHNSQAGWDFVDNESSTGGGSVGGVSEYVNEGPALSGPGSFAQMRYFLKFTGLETSTTPTKGFEGYVEIQDYAFSFESLARIADSNELVIEPIIVRGDIGGALYDLLKTANEGQGFAEMEIVVARSSSDTGVEKIQKIALNNVYIQSLYQEALDDVKLELVFSNLKYQTSQTDAKTGKITFDETFLDLGRNDYVTGSPGDDRFLLGKGDDTGEAATGKGDDFYDGGDGIDTLLFTSAVSGVTIDLTASEANAYSLESDTDRIINVENIISGIGNDSITGDDEDNAFDSGAGDDTLTGGAGDDTLTGGEGADIFVFAAGDGADEITDFTIGEDRLDVSGHAIPYSDIGFFAETGGLRVQLGADSVFLLGVSGPTLSASDFIGLVPENAAPTLSGPEQFDVDLTTLETDPQMLQFVGADIDEDSLTFTVSGADAAEVSINAGTGVLSYIGALGGTSKRILNVVIGVSDGQSTTHKDLEVTLWPKIQVGSPQTETLSGTSSDELFLTGLGADINEGQGGDDVFRLSPTDHDAIWEANRYTYASQFTLGDGTPYGATLTGKVRVDDAFLGGEGHDRIEGTDADEALLLFDPNYSATNPVLQNYNARIIAVEAFLLGAGHDIVDLTSEDFQQAYLGDALIDGGAGDDALYDGAGASVIIGGLGRDSILGNKGDDTMTGGEAGGSGDGVEDRFIYGPGSGGGRDVITDFEVGIDKIWVIGYGAQNFAAATTGAAPLLSWTDDGTDTTVRIDDGRFVTSILLQDVTGVNGGDAGDFFVFDTATTPPTDPGTNATPISGTPGDDQLAGTAQHDRLLTGAGADIFDAGAGDDQFELSATQTDGIWEANRFTYASQVSMSNGTPFGATLTGKIRVDDTFLGGAGQDSLIGTGVGEAVLLFDPNYSGINSVLANFNARIMGVDVFDMGAGDDIVDLTSELEQQGYGADVLMLGGTGDDFLMDGAGNSTLVGGAGSDRLVGWKGDDVLTGGDTGGSGDGDDDRFIFSEATGGGTDHITDYEDGIDTLWFVGFGLGTMSEALSAGVLTVETGATDTVLTLTGGGKMTEIVLDGFIGELGSTDLLFFA